MNNKLDRIEQSKPKMSRACEADPFVACSFPSAVLLDRNRNDNGLIRNVAFGQIMLDTKSCGLEAALG
ncbi:hypothetical protein QVD17_10039 [Tagetes erecta]|uniref:Uncharacterized protein n=1 Tax=Tagetes erecta TaxID=13708 RepID=A0AAD8L4Z7_TARER|nr:hypothetical protein QVD17_10039 [Tagetes erecta]